MSYDEHLISMAGGDGDVSDYDVDFGEPDPVVVPKTYTEAEVREAQARAYDKGYTHGRHDGEHHLKYRLSHTPRPEKSRRNPYRTALTGDAS